MPTRREAAANPGRDLADAALEGEVGRPARARALLARFDSAKVDSIQERALEPAHHIALAALALAEGRGLDAVREFRTADQIRDGPNGSCYICADPSVGLGFDRASMPDSAIAAFEHFVRSAYAQRVNVDGMNLAWVLPRLGQLYDAKGNTAKARDYYRQFVEVWKTADRELQPHVEAIRARLRQLEQQERRSR